MFSKLLIINLFIIFVTCERIRKDQLIIQINDEIINMGNPKWHSNSNINIYNIMYDYVENRKLAFTCKYANVPGKCHRMIWLRNDKQLEDKLAQPYNRETDNITVDWTPTSSSVLKCQIYVGIDDIKTCDQSSPKLIAILRFRPQQNVETYGGKKLNELSILGLEKSNILHNNTDSVKYKFKDGDTLNLTCTFNHRYGQFHMTWFKDGLELAKTSTVPRNTTHLGAVIHLNKDDDTSIIQCNITEDTSDKNKKLRHKTIELVYESEDVLTVTTELTVTATDVATYSHQPKENTEHKNIIYLIMLILLVVVAIIIIVIIIVLLKKHHKKNKEKEDKRTLQGSTSDTNLNLKCSDTYSNPADTMNYVSAVYSSPYKGVVYSTPIPKNARTVNKIDYENLNVKHKIPHNVVDKTCYENSNNYNTTYANLDDKNSNQYSNTLCNSNNGSDMYSYIVVDK